MKGIRKFFVLFLYLLLSLKLFQKLKVKKLETTLQGEEDRLGVGNAKETSLIKHSRLASSLPHILSRMTCPEWLGTHHGFVSPKRCTFISPWPLLENTNRSPPLLGASGSCRCIHWENQLQPNYLRGLISIV